MTKDKITVKDLATELNILPNELQQTLQILSIEVKNNSSPLAMAQVERVRTHYKDQKQKSVIVRRRSKAASPQSGTSNAQSGTSLKSSSNASPASDEHSSDKHAKKNQPVQSENAKTNETKSQAHSKGKKSKDSSPKFHSDARIITMPNQKINDALPKTDDEVLATSAKEEQVSPASDKTSAVNQCSSESLESTATTVEQNELKVTSKEATEESSVEKSEQNTKTNIVESNHSQPTTSDALANAQGSSDSAASTHSNEEKSSEKASDKGSEKATDKATDKAFSQHKKRERGGKKRSEPEQVQTPVRIISLPKPEAKEKPKSAGDGRPSSAQDTRGHRSNQESRGNFRPRPGADSKDGPDNRSDNRTGRDSRDNKGGNRPARPAAAPRSDMSFGAPSAPGALNEQSKKKRNKGRRTVDFQQGGGDFGRYGQDEENTKRMGSRQKSRRKGKDLRQNLGITQPLKAAKRKIKVTEAIRVSDMAKQMGLKSTEIITVLFNLGVMATINQSLDLETAALVAAEFEYEVEKVGFSEDDYLIPTEADSPDSLLPRPPVVTIMGHVDHGKTSLLDAIRKSNVTSGEAGGITQHIGAYHVRTKRGEIVFLDTPGHEAFTAMRARGAQITDLVILVVAADDGVMEQTREAINHSKAAGVSIMVAVNKMDKEGADPDRVLRELAELGLQAESWGGDTVTALVSAKSRKGLDELLELVALQAEILELKANPSKPARGRIVEAKLDKGRGPVATVLIQEGTLNQGDTFVCGVFSGRVRALFNDQGKKVKDAGPSIPVEVQGFDGVPEAGEEFVCVADEKLARRIADARATKQRERALAKESKVTLETFLSRRASDQEALTLNLVLKADVQGSLEAITEGLHKLSTEKVRINVVHGGAGAISESDILLASASQAIIIGFNIRPTAKIKEVAEHENVDIRYYDIIYKLADDIKNAMQGMLAPVHREQYLGQADVRDAINVPKVGLIAGCHVADGKITRNAAVRLLRDGVVIYTGKVGSLRRFKDDVKEVLKGYECGIGLENYNDIKIGDVIEAYEMIEEAATL